MNTVAEETKESTRANARVITDGATCEYWIDAIEAAVMGNVYAHHEIENLQKIANHQRTPWLGFSFLSLK